VNNQGERKKLTQRRSTLGGHSMPGTINADAEPASTDEQLMLAFARGSTTAFAELFSRYKQPIFGFFRRRLANPDHADELTQETFLAIFRAASTYEPRALFRTWLYAIAMKILYSHRRKSTFRAMFFNADSATSEPATRETTTSEIILREALGRLPKTDREILMLREFEQLNYAEISGILQLPLNTVRSRLFRARTALRDLLTSPLPAPPTPALTKFEERI
jgi:RNA polymerase sigma-70 factor, ECF subfamily